MATDNGKREALTGDIVRAKDVPLIQTSALSLDDLPPIAFDLITAIETGEQQHWALQRLAIDSNDFLYWRLNCKDYRDQLARSRTIAVKRPAMAKAYLSGSSLALAQGLVHNALHAKYERDQITAQVAALKAVGIGNDSSSVNVQVNVGQSAKAYLSQTTDDTPKT